MGHNWVLTKTADMQGAVNDGMAAGLPSDYVKKDDARVIAHTKVIGGGESDSVTFDVSKLAAGQDYTYFCSFPGHFAMMKGTQAGRLTRPRLAAPRPHPSAGSAGAFCRPAPAPTMTAPMIRARPHAGANMSKEK